MRAFLEIWSAGIKIGTAGTRPPSALAPENSVVCCRFASSSGLARWAYSQNRLSLLLSLPFKWGVPRHSAQATTAIWPLSDEPVFLHEEPA
jgi:hypothetical protein